MDYLKKSICGKTLLHFMERRRELFKRYIEEKKLLDTLSRLIVSLYERAERPVDPLTYIRDFFSTETGGIDIAGIRQENIALARKLTELNLKLLELEKRDEPQQVEEEEQPEGEQEMEGEQEAPEEEEQPQAAPEEPAQETPKEDADQPAEGEPTQTEEAPKPEETPQEPETAENEPKPEETPQEPAPQ